MVNSMFSYSGLSQGFWGEAMAVVRLPDLKLKTLGKRGHECIFVGYAKHSKAYRFYVIEPNDSVVINSIIESRDAIFNEHRFSSVPRPSQRSLVKGTKDSGGSVVPEKITDEIIQQSEPELRKSKRHRTPKDFGPEFQLYLIKGTRDEVSDQHSYCFNIEDDPKTFDGAIKSQDVAFWKEAINDEMDSIMGNNTWVLTDLPPGCRPLGCKWILKRKMKVDGTVEKFKARLSDYSLDGSEDSFLEGGTGRGVKVDLTKEFLSSRFSKKDIGEADVILGIRIKHKSNSIAISQSHYIVKVLKKFNYSGCTPVSTPLDTCENLMPNRGLVVSQLEYSRVIGCLMYAMIYTRPDIAFDVGKLSRYTSNLRTQHWQAIQRVLKYLKKTMDYRLLYFGYPSVLEEFVALAAAGKEAEWLKNLLLEIPLWVKPMAPISIRCDSAATLAKAYSQMYNGKSIHLGVRHSMIHKLIMNGVVSIEFVRSQQNLVDHLTKGLARDLVIKSAKGMGLNAMITYLEVEERFAIELTPSTLPQRHFAGDRFPQRYVAGEKVGMLLGKASNVVVTLCLQASGS
ncbi:zinc finger, CCHC-type containing protein [Tanacetum coccineum]